MNKPSGQLVCGHLRLLPAGQVAHAHVTSGPLLASQDDQALRVALLGVLRAWWPSCHAGQVEGRVSYW